MDTSDPAGRNVLTWRTDLLRWTCCLLFWTEKLRSWFFSTNAFMALLTFNVVEHIASFISHGHTRQSNSLNLKTPFCRANTFQASYFDRITNFWNFVCTLKSTSSFPITQSFKDFVHKIMFSNSVNTFEVERSCTWTLVMTCSCHRLKWPCLPYPHSCIFFNFCC